MPIIHPPGDAAAAYHLHLFVVCQHDFKMAYPILCVNIKNVVFSYSGEDSFVFHSARNHEVSCKVFLLIL